MKKIWKLLCFFAQHESSCPFLSCVMLCFFVLLLYCFYDMYIVLFNL